MTFDKVKQIIAEQLGIDESTVKEDSKVIADLGADSLDIVELVMTVEDEFGVTVEDSQLEKIVTVADIVKLIDKK